MEEIKEEIYELVYYWVSDPAQYINHEEACKKILDDLLNKINAVTK